MRFSLLIVSLFLAAHAEDTLTKLNDTVPVHHHFVGFDPISACLGTLLLNYEYVASRHGAFIEGSYTIPWFQKGYTGTVAYRYHFDKADKGGFVGPTFRMGYVSAKIPDEYKRDFTYSLKWYAIGAGWGTRGSLWKKFHLLYVLRLGVGYPFHTLSWDQQPPETINGIDMSFYQKLLKFPAYLDSELALSIPF